ncbi:T9SS type A sorting domain-containing protein [Phaeocystidibacter luteus]|uniref:T9SS type A sorting domain-containing protein n=1 Tax=Phaeocystidibacter luteus TaxID=911197 RepID=A0A6N6RHU0_9FLAO|nr:T9SS type A sorting domain-containing protein [Phaeocystidibacter luteus]KAB2813844.1 T9SS type A sorting domain-containing protein [Phaeocystidibacter luteus]
MIKRITLLLTAMIAVGTLNAHAQGVNFELMDSFGPHEQVKFELSHLSYSKIDAGDIDGDGNIDLIIAGEAGSNLRHTEIYMYNGSDSYDTLPGQGLPGIIPVALRFVDLDSDSDLDIFMSGRQANGQYITEVRLNDGSGNFTLANSGALPTNVKNAEFGDLDNDGDLDLVISTSSAVSVYQNNGSAFFSIRTNVSLPSLVASDIEIADIDYDNHLDIVYMGKVPGTSNGQLQVVYNDSNWTFSAFTIPQATFIEDCSIVCANFDGDSLMDILYVGDAPSGVLLLQDSISQFTVKSNIYPQGFILPVMHVYDRDNDGDEDLFITGRNRQGVTTHYMLYENFGDGSFSLTDGHELDLKPNHYADHSAAVMEDLNGDGNLDVIVGSKNGPWSLYHGTVDHKFYYSSLSSFGSIIAIDQAVADFDGDGSLDIVIMNSDSTRVYYNSGSGEFPTSQGLDHFASTFGDIATGDFNNDGHEDIVYAGSWGATKIFWNDGTGDFSGTPTSLADIFQLAKIEVFDADGDSDLDIFVTGAWNDDDALTALYLNDGTGQFTSAQNIGIPPTWRPTLASGDLDLDGDIDLIITGGPGNNIYLNNGQGVFTSMPVPFTTTYFLAFCELVDFNGDGLLDIFSSRSSTPNATIYENLGNGTFSYRNRFGPMYQIIICDANHDGFPDIVESGEVHLNDGAGNFTFTLEPNTGIRTANNSGAVGVAADFDGDTDDDIFYAGVYAYQSNFYVRYTQLYRNTATGISVAENDNPGNAFPQVYPNPMKDRSVIELPEGTFNGHIIDLSGRVVRSIDNASNELVIERDGLNNGIYMLVLTNDKGETNTTKFVIR